MTPMEISVLGGGNGAFAHAADLAIKGNTVNLCEVPEFKENLDGIIDKHELRLTVTGNPGLQAGVARLNKVTTSAEEALEDANVVMIVVPAFAQKRFAEFCAPFVRDDHLIMLSPGNFGGCLEFSRILRKSGNSARPILCETECMTYSGFKTGADEVEVSGYKHGHTVAAFPGKMGVRAVAILRDLFPTIKGADSILETGLRNANSVVHAPIALLNSGRIENTKGDFLFYWDGCTRGVGNVVEKVEQERLLIGESMGLNLPRLRDVLLEWYSHSGASGDSLAEVLRTNPVYKIDYAPKQLNHRFFTEDIPYGMVPMEEIGRVAEVPTPTITGVIDLACAALMEDLREKARGLSSLGLSGYSFDDLKNLFLDGGDIY